MEDLILKQKAFFEAGNTLDTRSRRAMLQILANTVKDLRGDTSETEGFLALVADLRAHLYKWTRTGRLRMLMSLFARPADDGPVPLGTVLVDASAADSLEAILAPLACALAAGDTAVVLTPASDAGDAVRRIVDETFTDDFVATIPAGSPDAATLDPQAFDFVSTVPAASPTSTTPASLPSALSGFLTFSKSS